MLVADVPKLGRATPNVQASPPDWSYKTKLPVSLSQGKQREREGGRDGSSYPSVLPSAVSSGAADDSAGEKHVVQYLDGTTAVTKFTPTHGQSGVVVTATTANGFHCSLKYSLSASTASDSAAPELFAVMALDGHWLEGVIRSRTCIAYRCRTPDCPTDPLYSSLDDWNASTVFDSIELKGNFTVGDLVLPMVATSGGEIVMPESLDDGLESDWMRFQGGHMVLDNFSRPLLNAMLYAPL
jgi:hypothetical protein